MTNKKLYEVFAAGVKRFSQSAHPRIRENAVCGFFPLRGSKYNHDLMVVGRATNGWLTEEHETGHTAMPTAEELSCESKIDAFLNVIRKDAQSKDPMDWVLKSEDDSGYNTRRSAFWRVAKQSIFELKGAQDIEDYWPSYLAWSNLYKIAPWKGGNPGTLMCAAQQDWAVQMLRLEIQTFAPRNILFMTGYRDWAEDFLFELGFRRGRKLTNSHVEAFGQLKVGSNSTTRVVVVPHPQSKPEGEIVQQAVRHFV